jgi:F0F1-type ATP synthase membrane subunit c/vacuolar-type H+-ATPase subunit K
LAKFLKNMKRLAILLLVILLSGFMKSTDAQNNVGIGTTTPNVSALLDLTSTSKGLLIPRVTLLAAGNGTSPVNSPATGLLVYNTGGALSAGFWYWNGTLWTQIGAGGGGCSTLDLAYDCGGAGAGRSITADAGAVSITLPSGASQDYGLSITSNKGTQAVPSSPIYAVNNQHGTALFVETTLGANLYGGIQSSSNITNTNTAYLPAAISGYKFGNGIGTGVYGEAIGNGSIAGAGVTGYSQNTNFGGDFYAANFVGLQAETGANGTQALQVVSAGAVTTQPSMLAYGWSQFRCSPNGTGHSVIANNLAGEATWAASAGSYGYLGTASVAWWYLYYYNATAVSRRELKRNITSVEGDIAEYVMADIEKMKPSFYKFNVETDEFVEGNEAKVRYNMHMGLILDETPDYIQDNAFSGIDVYALATMAITGVQYNRNSIKHIETQISQMQSLIQDFGVSVVNGTEVRVNYSKDFRGAVPVVNITPTNPVSGYYISSQDSEGFTIKVAENQSFGFNWMAFANAPVQAETQSTAIEPSLMSQLQVDESKKLQMSSWALSLKQESMELKKNNQECRPMGMKNIKEQ